MAVVRHKEAIHSGHFMISDFDAEVEADEDIVSHPPAAEDTETNCPKTNSLPQLIPPEEMETSPPPSKSPRITKSHPACKASKNGLSSGTNGISWGKGISMRSSSRFVTDVSLKKLLQSMTIAYRHKLTSPKWNKFRGLRLRWKDKIRLNNVIWRCWHLQFIRGKKHILCKFANPLEIDNHNRVESGTLLEGKYWKRKLRAVMQEYKRWRMFYKNQVDSVTRLGNKKMYVSLIWSFFKSGPRQPTFLRRYRRRLRENVLERPQLPDRRGL